MGIFPFYGFHFMEKRLTLQTVYLAHMAKEKVKISINNAPSVTNIILALFLHRAYGTIHHPNR